MFNQNQLKNEKIELELPVNAAYVSAARLTASSIANRMGFNIEDIEDIKAAVSEACTYIIKSHIIQSSFKIIFLLNNNSLEIQLVTKDAKDQNPFDPNELGIMMIQALMDTLSVDEKDETVTISMKKNRNKLF